MGQRFLTLSAGQRTRVNLVKALLNDPEVVLMDEPTASLDPDIADRTLSLIESLRASRDLAIVYTSHQMDEVTRICDEVIFLDRGRIVAQDTPADLTERMANARLRVTFDGQSDLVASALQPQFGDVSLTDDNVVEVTTEERLVPRRLSISAAAGVRSSTSTSRNRRWRTCSCRSRVATGEMSLERIRAVLLQEIYITARSVEVIVDLPFWSLMTVWCSGS